MNVVTLLPAERATRALRQKYPAKQREQTMCVKNSNRSEWSGGSMCSIAPLLHSHDETQAGSVHVCVCHT